MVDDVIPDWLGPDENEKEITPEEAEELLKRFLAMDLAGKKIECANYGGDMYRIEALVKTVRADGKNIIIELENPMITREGEDIEEKFEPLKYDQLELELLKPVSIRESLIWLDCITLNLDYNVDFTIIYL